MLKSVYVIFHKEKWKVINNKSSIMYFNFKTNGHSEKSPLQHWHFQYEGWRPHLQTDPLEKIIKIQWRYNGCWIKNGSKTNHLKILQFEACTQKMRHLSSSAGVSLCFSAVRKLANLLISSENSTATLTERMGKHRNYPTIKIRTL